MGKNPIQKTSRALRKFGVPINNIGMSRAMALPMQYKGEIYKGRQVVQYMNCIRDRLFAGVNVQLELPNIIRARVIKNNVTILKVGK